jgi:hypothetical protein
MPLHSRSDFTCVHNKGRRGISALLLPLLGFLARFFCLLWDEEAGQGEGQKRSFLRFNWGLTWKA